ncbi:MAG: hypothetical protein KAH72_04200, partial [Flavobacteriaceae bacterium]|nr:hypothetical protein [Flavobacteriaceae bacterium]
MIFQSFKTVIQTSITTELFLICLAFINPGFQTAVITISESLVNLYISGVSISQTITVAHLFIRKLTIGFHVISPFHNTVTIFHFRLKF